MTLELLVATAALIISGYLIGTVTNDARKNGDADTVYKLLMAVAFTVGGIAAMSSS